MAEKVEKIVFGGLYLEITKRCQLKCIHCMRGDSEDVDMSNEIVDSILDQCSGIFEVFFTGGEPTLNVDTMDYFLQEVQKRNIPLGKLTFITNGISITDQLKNFLLRAYDYITECRKECEIFKVDSSIAVHPRLQIGISSDNYHLNTNPDKAKSIYNSFLPNEGCHVFLHEISGILKIGKAKELKNAISHPFKHYNNIQIGIAYKDHNLICMDSIRANEVTKFCDAYIPCFIGVTAKGKVVPRDCMDADYESENYNFQQICEYSNGKMPSIVKSVLEYNIGKLPCYIAKKIPMKIESSEIPHILKRVEDEEYYYFDPIFHASKLNIGMNIEQSIQMYDMMYMLYLADRIPLYSDREYFHHDFPYSNEYFYQKVLDARKQGTQKTIAFILENKDHMYYRVDEDYIDQAKQQIRDFSNAIFFEDDNNNGQLYSKNDLSVIHQFIDDLTLSNEDYKEYINHHSTNNQ